MGTLIGRPEPSKAAAETPPACSRFRNIIVPVTGSISVGERPLNKSLILTVLSRLLRLVAGRKQSGAPWGAPL